MVEIYHYTHPYSAREAEELDLLRNKVHDLIKKYAPSADDLAVGQDVLSTLPERNIVKPVATA